MKKKLLLLLFSLLFIPTFVMAMDVDPDDILYNSYVIGTHLYTYPTNDIYDTSNEPSAIFDESGVLYTVAIMYGSSSIESVEVSDMIVYYKDFFDTWVDGLTGEELNIPNTFYITHVNGICIDPACMGGSAGEVTVTFSSVFGATLNGGTSDVSVQVKYGTKLAAADLPKVGNRPGYKFNCWEQQGSSDCFDFTQQINNSITLKDTWEALSYNITYDLNGGSATGIPGGSVQCEVGSSTNSCVTPNVNPTRSGYDFLGWAVEDNDALIGANSSLDPVLGMESNITMVAQWKPIDYTITYDLNGGDRTISSITGTLYGSYNVENRDSIVLTSPVREGYEFKYWQDENGRVSSLENKTGDLRLTAMWNPVAFKVTYSDSLKPQECTYNNCVISRDNPSGSGFRYWAGSNGYYYVKGNNISGVKQNITLTAVFNSTNTHSINLHSTEGTLPDNYIDSYVEGVGTNLPIPIRSGYLFKGWYTSAVGGTSVDHIPATATADYELYAQWTERKITITYDLNGGSGDFANITCVLDGSQCNTKNEAPTKAGYTFVGWSLTDNNNDLININSDIHAIIYGNVEAGNVTLNLHAIWQINRYNINYQLDGGVFTSAPITVFDVNTTGNLPLAEKADYQFLGWKLNGVYKDTYASLGNSDVTLIADWQARTFQVAYDLNGGIGDITAHECATDNGCTITDVVPTKEGMEFIGWLYQGYLFETGQSTSFAGFNVTNNSTVTLTALWGNKERHFINYDLNGGGFIGTPINSYSNGDSGDLPTAQKEGYEFNGWKFNDVTYERIEQLTGDVSLIAQWTEKTFTINYVVPDGYTYDGPVSQTCSYESGCTVPNNIPYDENDWSHSFYYWTSNDIQYVKGDVIDHRTEDVILTAFFGPLLSYELDLNGGTMNNTGGMGSTNAVSYGENVEYIPERDGYTFVGYIDQNDKVWLPGEDNLVHFIATTDTYLKAVWNEKEFRLNFVTDPRDYSGYIPSVEKSYYETYTFDNSVMDIQNIGPNRTLYGWSDGETIYKLGDTITEKSGVINLNAVWNYPLYYDENVHGGISYPTPYSFVQGIEFTIEETPIGVGYTFTGWNTKADGTGDSYQPGDHMTSYDEVHLYAQWEAVDYNIIYELNGGAVDPSNANPSTYNLDQEYITLVSPTREGYRFMGWNVIDDLNRTDGTKYFDQIPTNMSWINETGVITINANWEEEFSLSYDYDGGSLPGNLSNPSTYIASEESINLAIPEKKNRENVNRTLIGWDLSGAEGRFNDDFTILTIDRAADATLKAKWDKNEVTFVYSRRGIDYVDYIDFDYDQRIGAQVGLSMGVVCEYNWYSDSDFQTDVDLSRFTVTSDVTIYGKRVTNQTAWC